VFTLGCSGASQKMIGIKGQMTCRFSSLDFIVRMRMQVLRVAGNFGRDAFQLRKTSESPRVEADTNDTRHVEERMSPRITTV
jgi:hypothetical protein